MARLAEKLETSELAGFEGRRLDDIRSDRAMGQEHGENILSFEAGKIRNDLLERMNQKKGVISKGEEAFWKEKLHRSYQDVSRLQSIKSEFEEHWKRSIEMRTRFDSRVHRAEEEGLLYEGEHEKLDNTFSEKDLREKEDALKAFEKEAEIRMKRLQKFAKLEEVVQEQRGENFKKAQDYGERIKILEEAEKFNENYVQYSKKLKKYEKVIGQGTTYKFMKWFAEQSMSAQSHAMAELDNQMKPYEKTMEVHGSLPPEYQEPQFKEWGMTQRLNHLAQAENKIGTSYRKVLQTEAAGILCERSIEQAEQSFSNVKGKDSAERLKKKMDFLKALPGHIRAEKKLKEKFEKTPDKIQAWMAKEFRTSTYEEKKKLLEDKIPRLIAKYTKALNAMNNQVDAHVAQVHRGAFDQADSIDEMESVVKEANQFQKEKNAYYKLRRDNHAEFNSPAEEYFDWYEKEIHSMEGAEKATGDLKKLIKEHKAFNKRVRALPPHLRGRLDLSLPFAKRQKQLDDLKLEDIAKSQGTIVYLIKDAETKEKIKDFNGALAATIEALKLDPKNPDLQKMAAHLKQKGAQFKGNGASKSEKQRIDEILESIEEQPKISDQMMDLARRQILLDLTKLNEERIGASGDTLQARANAARRGMDEKNQALAEAIDETDELIVDETETVRKTTDVKMQGEQSQETQIREASFFETGQHRKLKGLGGAIDFKFTNANGQEMGRQSAQRENENQRNTLNETMIKLMRQSLEKEGVPLTAEQEKALEKKMQEDFETMKEAA